MIKSELLSHTGRQIQEVAIGWVRLDVRPVKLASVTNRWWLGCLHHKDRRTPSLLYSRTRQVHPSRRPSQHALHYAQHYTEVTIDDFGEKMDKA